MSATMIERITKKTKEIFCLCLALFGLAVVGIGIQKIYEPLVYIYAGIILIYFAYLGTKQK